MRTLTNAAKKTSERLDPDVAQRRETLDRDERSAGERDKSDDRYGASDDRHRTGAHTDLGDEPQRRKTVMAQHKRDLPQRCDHEERHMVSAAHEPCRCAAPTSRARIASREAGTQNHSCRHVNDPFRTVHRLSSR